MKSVSIILTDPRLVFEATLVLVQLMATNHSMHGRLRNLLIVKHQMLFNLFISASFVSFVLLFTFILAFGRTVGIFKTRL